VVLRRWARPGWEIDDPHYTPPAKRTCWTTLAPTSVPAAQMLAADP
jgi:hypothetical protein